MLAQRKPGVAQLHISRPRKLMPPRKIPESAKKSVPSGNWLALQKKFVSSKPSKGKEKEKDRGPPRKKRKVETSIDDKVDSDTPGTSSFPRGRASVHQHTKESSSIATNGDIKTALSLPDERRNGESTSHLRRMILGEMECTPEQQQPGRFLALDCEMVGIGIDGVESALARVSIVNYHGAVQLDAFVRPQERVVDYRTEFSGIRESDMVHARPFAEVQKEVADLLKDKVLVGHAIHNDLKVLLLSHPGSMIRDTQRQAGKAKLLKTRYPALRKLVQQELGLTIQAGEHSSVTDARATMALYRLYRKDWDKGWRPLDRITSASSKKRARSAAGKDADAEGVSEDDSSDEGKRTAPPSRKASGKKGAISSGLSTVIKRKDGSRVITGKATALTRTEGTKEKWWKTLGSGSSGAKATIRV